MKRMDIVVNFVYIPWLEDISIRHKNGRTWGQHRSFYTRFFEGEPKNMNDLPIRTNYVNGVVLINEVVDEAHKVDTL